VMAEERLEEIEPRAYGLLVKFLKHNELRTGEGRLAERTGLATPQRAGGTG
jgi:hypothetical protein